MLLSNRREVLVTVPGAAVPVEDGCRDGKQALVLGTLHTKESEGCNATELLCQMTFKM